MEKKWCVYEHVFPNGKKYIGITCDTLKRWRDGKGYDGQKKIANAIKHYGWNKIQHNVILEGLGQEQAKRLEQYLIAELNTIEDGYNTTIGGDNITSTYLVRHVLDMLYEVRKHGEAHTIRFDDGDLDLPNFIYSDRYNIEASGFWNEADRAVTIKHGKQRPGNERERFKYFYYMAQYYLLWLAMQEGKDVSGWKEQDYDEYQAELLACE